VSSDDFGFAPPPFNPEAALVPLRRSLRELGLAERGNGYELRGRRVVELDSAPGSIAVRLARRPALTPEWDRQQLQSAADSRKLLDELKKRLARWERDEHA
jgi:hypothetical protein